MSRGAVVEHEGPSIWSWRTSGRILRHLHLRISKNITPLTEDLMAAQVDGLSSYLDLQLRVRAEIEKRRECPAGHPVAPFELRASMDRKRLMFQSFPNVDGNPTSYIPIRFWLCVTCQAVYRAREVQEVVDAQAV